MKIKIEKSKFLKTKKRIESWKRSIGAKEKNNSDIQIGGLTFTQEEIFKHPDINDLENKIVDYIEQL